MAVTRSELQELLGQYSVVSEPTGLSLKTALEDLGCEVRFAAASSPGIYGATVGVRPPDSEYLYQGQGDDFGKALYQAGRELLENLEL